MPKFSDIKDLPVLCADEGRVAGRITGVLIDGGRRAAACLLVDLDKWYLGVQALPFDRITGISPIAVMTAGMRELKPIADDERFVRIAQSGARIEGLDVYTPQGDVLGIAEDFIVDATGAIQAVVLDGGQEIPCRYIQAIGPDAIIAEFEYEVVRLDAAREQPSREQPAREAIQRAETPTREPPREPQQTKPEAPPRVDVQPRVETQPRAQTQQVLVPSGGGNITVRTGVSSSAQGVQLPR